MKPITVGGWPRAVLSAIATSCFMLLGIVLFQKHRQRRFTDSHQLGSDVYEDDLHLTRLYKGRGGR